MINKHFEEQAVKESCTWTNYIFVKLIKIYLNFRFFFFQIIWGTKTSNKIRRRFLKKSFVSNLLFFVCLGVYSILFILRVMQIDLFLNKNLFFYFHLTLQLPHFNFDLQSRFILWKLKRIGSCFVLLFIVINKTKKWRI